MSLFLAEEETSGVSVALVAGALGGLAYLTRNAGIVMLASSPLVYWMRRKRMHAVAFFGGMIPFVLGWTLWSRANILHTSDPDVIYYTSYTIHYLNNVTLQSVPSLLWKNLDALLTSLGSYVLPQVFTIGLLKGIAWVTAITMIAGVVRLVRAGHGTAYAYFGAGSAVLLLVWNFPPNERLALVLLPLALAGLVYELKNFLATMAKGLKHPKMDQRVVGAMMIGIVGLILLGSLALQLYVGQVFIPDGASAQRKVNIPNRAAYAWLLE